MGGQGGRGLPKHYNIITAFTHSPTPTRPQARSEYKILVHSLIAEKISICVAFSVFRRCSFSVFSPVFCCPNKCKESRMRSVLNFEIFVLAGTRPPPWKGKKGKCSLRRPSPCRLLRPRQVIILCNITQDHDRGRAALAGRQETSTLPHPRSRHSAHGGRPRPCTPYGFSTY